MKLITVLGTGSYSPATYVYQGKEFETELFPEALVCWWTPDEVMVLLTPEAREHRNWRTLQERLPGTQLRAVDLPVGKSEEELWEAFSAVAKALSPGDRVLFDVTHGFRSLPMLTLLAAAYLRAGGLIELEQVLYGAYEARDDSNRAPVFDLTPFVLLFDWVCAADRFAATGDSRKLGELVKQRHVELWRTHEPEQRSYLPRRLHRVGEELAKLSDAPATIRPAETARHSRRLRCDLEAARAELNRFAPPFALLLERVEKTAAAFAADDHASQRHLVRWYADHHRFVEAIALAREWPVGWVGTHLGAPLVQDRWDVEEALNRLAATRPPKSRAAQDLLPSLCDLPHVERVKRLWRDTVDLRSDLAHCGFRKDPLPAGRIPGLVVELLARLETLPVEEPHIPGDGETVQ